MDLETIQDELINNFDFDKALNILNKLDEEFQKEDLINISKGLIKMLYQSREMEEVFFSSGFIQASRTYVDEKEVKYSLYLSLGVDSNFTYDLENSFDKSIEDKESLKLQLEELLEINQKEYDENIYNDLAFSNIQKLEKILIQFD